MNRRLRSRARQGCSDRRVRGIAVKCRRGRGRSTRARRKRYSKVNWLARSNRQRKREPADGKLRKVGAGQADGGDRYARTGCGQGSGLSPASPDRHAPYVDGTEAQRALTLPNRGPAQTHAQRRVGKIG